MKTGKKIVKTIIIIILIFIVVLTSIVSLSYTLDKYDFQSRLIRFCEAREQMTFDEFTRFRWDIAYIDREYYGYGDDMKEKYGLEGKFRYFGNDSGFRIAFYRNNKLVKSGRCVFYISLNDDVEIIMPETIFNIKIEYIDKYNKNHIKLNPLS